MIGSAKDSLRPVGAPTHVIVEELTESTSSGLFSHHRYSARVPSLHNLLYAPSFNNRYDPSNIGLIIIPQPGKHNSVILIIMFGESESESPRFPSPWDLVLAPASVDKLYHRQDELLLPKLVAEVEEVRPIRLVPMTFVTCVQGNVEYKLHLISPTSARFARLVTQMKWRLLEGGGQAIYELGVADSGALVGLAPDDLRATLDTLHAMAAEIGARVTISKEIEVTITDVPEVGFRAQVDKRHGCRDSRRTPLKDHPRAQAFPIEAAKAASLSSFISATSTSTPSSLDSTASLLTDSCSLASDSSTLSSPSLPTSSVSVPVSGLETAHVDDTHFFPLLTDLSPRCSTPADGVISGGESLIGHNHLSGVPEKSLTGVENGLNIRELHRVQPGDVGPEPATTVVAVVDTLSDPDELLLAALDKLEVADSPSIPEEQKRTIVEALVFRELDNEEGFLDFSSF